MSPITKNKEKNVFKQSNSPSTFHSEEFCLDETIHSGDVCLDGTIRVS